MKDYLKELCASQNIELIYTDDNWVGLSTDVKDNMPCIKVNRIFMGCTEKVAKSIIAYYTEPGNKDDNLRVLSTYLFDNVVTVEYTIQSPDKSFESLFIKHSDNKLSPEVKKTKARASRSKTAKSKAPKASELENDTSSLVEANISSITRKNFYGRATKIAAGETIKPSSDDVIELDIEVDNSRQ